MTGASAIVYVSNFLTIYFLFFRTFPGIINSGLTAAILTREGGALSSFTIHDLIGKAPKKAEQRKNSIIVI